MILRHNAFSTATAIMLSFVVFAPAHAGRPMSDRMAVEAKVWAEVAKDMDIPYKPGEALVDRLSL